MNFRYVRQVSRLLFVIAIAIIGMASALEAQCTLQLSDQGVVRMSAGEQRTLTWNVVPGASSYLVEQLIEGLGDPAAPDFAFGGSYTESRNGEAPGLTSILVRHSVLYKMRFRYIVTALNRGNPSFQPCKADVLYVIDADQKLAAAASSRIVPIAGKARGMNGSDYSTALILAGTGLGAGGDATKLYQGRIVFRPLGVTASDADPSIDYGLNGDETLVFDDIMVQLGATGIGSLEIIPKTGYPTPLADAIIDNKLADGHRTGARVPAVWGRDQLAISDSVTVGIRNSIDTRLSLGVRTLGTGGRLFFQHLSSNGQQIDTAERFAGPDVTLLYSLRDLFSSLASGDRIIAHYQPIGPTASNGVVLFLTETGNDLNNPNVVYRDSLDNPHFSRGFDRFIVY
jgi:hypothetical protein